MAESGLGIDPWPRWTLPEGLSIRSLPFGVFLGALFGWRWSCASWSSPGILALPLVEVGDQGVWEESFPEERDEEEE